jgi:dimeric dUTPase (all-alpha-NTP-PPase superfamily)
MEKQRCMNLKPENMGLLPEEDSIKKMLDMQELLQERLGRMSLYRNSNMKAKCDYAKDNIYHLNAELVEMLERLPFKHWKKYSPEMEKDWTSEEQRTETLFEYIDALHFFINIALIFGFTPEEIFNYYMAKNKENHDRQNRGY